MTTRQQVYNRRFLRTSRLPFCSRESKSGHEEDILASLCCSHSTTRKSFWLDHHRPATSVRGPREPLPRTVRWVAFFAAALFRFQVAFSHELFLLVARIFFRRSVCLHGVFGDPLSDRLSSPAHSSTLRFVSFIRLVSRSTIGDF